MKRFKLGSTLKHYTISYVGIAMLSCALIGLVLFTAFVNEFRKTENKELLNKITLAADYIEKQQQMMAEISYTIQNTIYYMPSYIKSNKYNEIIMLEDFKLYRNYTPLTQEYFFFYRDSDYIYKPTSGNKFNAYMQYELNFKDADAVYDQLNSATSFTIVSSEENPNILMMAFPLYISEKKSAGNGDATLCFVVDKANLFNCIYNAIGEIKGNIYIYYDGRYVASSAGISQTDIMLDQLDDNEVIDTYSSENLFYILHNSTQSSAYDYLIGFQRLSIVLVALVASMMLILAFIVAYRNYQPLRMIVRRYEKLVPQDADCKDEIRQINMMLDSAIKKNQMSSYQLNAELKQLNYQQSVIKKQFLRLLIHGDIDKNMAANMKYLGVEFPNPYYSMFVVQMEAKQNANEKLLQSMIEDLSDDTIIFHTITLKYQYRFAVMVIMKYKALEYKAADLIDAIGEENDLKLNICIGFTCDNIKELPASFLDALSKKEPSYQNTDSEMIESANDFLYNNTMLRKIISEIENADTEKAVLLLNCLLEKIMHKYPSVIIQRCILFDIINTFIRICHKNNLDILPEEVGSVLFLNDSGQFQERAADLIRKMCANIKENSEQDISSIQNEIILYINKHATDYDISLTKLSDKFGIHENKISQIVKEAQRMSYKDYLTSIRISRACEMIKGDNLTISKIGELTGFGNASYFIRVFKNITGLTPANYKRIMLMGCMDEGKEGETTLGYL